MDRNGRRSESGNWETARRIAAAEQNGQARDGGRGLNVIGGTGNGLRSNVRNGASGSRTARSASAASGPSADMLSGRSGTTGARAGAGRTEGPRASASRSTGSGQRNAAGGSRGTASSERNRTGSSRTRTTGTRTGSYSSAGGGMSASGRTGSSGRRSSAGAGRVVSGQRPPLGSGNGSRGSGRRRRRRGVGPGAWLVLAVLVVAVIGGAFFYIRNRNREQMQAYAQEGAELLAQGDYEAAIAALDAALAKSGSQIGEFEAEVLSCRAEAEYRQGDYEAALATYRKLMEAYPDDTDYKTGVVLCLIETGDLESALEIGVAQGRIYNQMAVQRIAIEDYEMAAQYIALGKAYTDDETAQKELAYNEAVVAEGTGDYEGALRLFQCWVTKYGSTDEAEREIEFLRTRVDNADEILAGTEGQEETDSGEAEESTEEESQEEGAEAESSSAAQ